MTSCATLSQYAAILDRDYI